MKCQFDVWRYKFPAEKGGEHPVVLISHRFCKYFCVNGFLFGFCFLFL